MIITTLNNARDLFNLFLRYDPNVGASSLFERVRVNFESLASMQNSLFAGLASARPEQGENLPGHPKTRFVHLLTGPNFQKCVIALALNAFPEKKRLIFVHVRKCAGSNLTRHFSRRYPGLANELMEEARTSSEQLFTALKHFVTELCWSDEVYIHGHITLQRCRDENLVRSQDRVITVLRDPAEILISHINYVITGLLADPQARQTDTKSWLKTLNIPSLDPTTSTDDLLRLAKRILHDTPLAPSNSICEALGRGDVVSSLENLAACNVEITTMKHYNTWLDSRWGIRSDQKVNVSRHILTAEVLNDRDRDRIRTLTVEDRNIFDLVAAQLEQSGQCFIRGAQLPTDRRAKVGARPASSLAPSST